MNENVNGRLDYMLALHGAGTGLSLKAAGLDSSLVHF